MAYDKFTVLKSTAVPMPIENVDTDQIIPARFLKATERKGLAITCSATGVITQTTARKRILC
jgi:3-isopropylmalate dehydratase small subunit